MTEGGIGGEVRWGGGEEEEVERTVGGAQLVSFDLFGFVFAVSGVYSEDGLVVAVENRVFTDNDYPTKIEEDADFLALGFIEMARDLGCKEDLVGEPRE